MDQGITSNFKCNYRKTLVQHTLAEIEENDKYEAIMFIVEAWKRVSDQTIKNCVCYEEKRTTGVKLLFFFILKKNFSIYANLFFLLFILNFS